MCRSSTTALRIVADVYESVELEQKNNVMHFVAFCCTIQFVPFNPEYFKLYKMYLVLKNVRLSFLYCVSSNKKYLVTKMCDEMLSYFHVSYDSILGKINSHSQNISSDMFTL